MSAVRLRLVAGHRKPARRPASPPGEYPGRVRLTSIAWGQPDEALGRMVCRHLEDANPPITIPFNPRTDRALRKQLHLLNIHH